MDDAHGDPLVEEREAAIGRLKEHIAAFRDDAEKLCRAIDECDHVLTRDEVTPLLRPIESLLHRAMHPFSLDVVIAGNLFHRLSDRDACNILKMIYGVLAPGGSIFFTADKEQDIRKWCKDFGLVVMQRDESTLLVEIRKQQ